MEKTDKIRPDLGTVATLTPAAALTVTGYTHCPYRRATDLLQRLAPGKMRVGFLIGAGCPLSVQVPDGEKTKPLIPDINGLTKLVKDALDLNLELKDVAIDQWPDDMDNECSLSPLRQQRALVLLPCLDQV